MKLPLGWFIAIGVGLMAVFPVILAVSLPPGPGPGPPGPVPSCPAIPGPLGLTSVPAGQTVLLGSMGENNSNPYGGSTPQWRLSIWSDSNSTYSLFLLTPDQYTSYAATGSGLNGSVHYNPPPWYYWSSGPVTSTNNTLLLGNGSWYLLVYNPGSYAISVSLESVSCNAPQTAGPAAI